MKTGSELIAEERKRQIEEEGFAVKHDSQHTNGELSRAGAIYALSADERDAFFVADPWPWDLHWFKPTPNDRIRELTKAGALIAAAIDVILNSEKQ
jgi:hypothetical protein